MPTTIDNRVVSMTFDNGQFEKEVSRSISTIDRLKQSLVFNQSGNNITTYANNASIAMNSLGDGVEAVKVKISALSAISATVLSTLTKNVITGAKRIIGAMPSAMVQGGINRALNIESAKFQLEGLGIAWDRIKEDIDYGVKDTAYGLDAAAKAAAQLSASGVTIGKEMQASLRAISGVAAMTNQSYEMISPIFTAVAGQGKLMTMQLRQLESRGLNAAAAIGKQLGKSEAEIRDMVTKGKIDFKTFATAMDDAFGAHAKDANKTFTGALSNMKAALARIGADVATPALEDLRDIFNSLRESINAVHVEIQPLLDGIAKFNHAISGKFVEFFADRDEKTGKGLNGRVKLLELLDMFLVSIQNHIWPVKKAFQDVFNGDIGSALIRAIEYITDFLDKTRLTSRAQEGLRKVIKGVFVLVKGLFTIIKKGFFYVGEAIKVIHKGIDYFLSAIGKLGKIESPFDFLKVWVDNGTIKDLKDSWGNAVENFKHGFDLLSAKAVTLGSVLIKSIPGLDKLKDFFKTLPLRAVGALIKLFDWMANIDWDKTLETIESIPDDIGTFIGGAVAKIKGFFSEKFAFVTSPSDLIIAELEQIKNISGENPILQMFSEGSTEDIKSRVQIQVDAVIAKIKEIVGNLDLQKLGITGFILGVLDIMFSTGSALFNFARIEKEISGVIKAAAKVVKKAGDFISGITGDLKKIASSIKEVAKAYKHQATAAMIKNITILLGVFVLSLIVLTEYIYRSGKNVTPALAIIAEFAVGVVVIMGMMALIAKAGGGGTSKVEHIVLGIAAAIIALVYGLTYLTKVPWYKALGAIVGVGLLMGALFGVLYGISHYATDAWVSREGIALVVAMAVSVRILVKSIIGIADAYGEDGKNADYVNTAFRKILTLMAGLFGIYYFMGKMPSPDPKAVSSLIIFIGSIWLLVKAMDFVAKYDWDAIDENWYRVAGCIGGVIMAYYLLSQLDTSKSDNAANIAKAMIGVVLSLILVVAAIDYMSHVLQKYDPDSVSAAYAIVVSIGALIGIMIYALKDVENANLSAKAIIGIAAAMVIIAVAVNAMTLAFAIDIAKAGAACLAIAVFLIEIGAIIKMLDKVENPKNVIGTVLSMALLIAVITGAVLVLETFSEDSIKMMEAAGSIGALLAACAGMIWVLSNYAKDGIKTSVIVASILSIVAIVGALYALSQTGIDGMTMIDYAVAIAIAMAGLALAMGLLSELTSSANGLNVLAVLGGLAIALVALGGAAALFGLGVKLMAEGLALLNKDQLQALSILGNTLTGLVGIFALVIVALSIIGSAVPQLGLILLAIAAVFISVGAAAVLTGWGFKMAAEGFKIAVDAMGVLVTVVQHLVEVVSEGLDVLVTSIQRLAEIGPETLAALPGPVMELAAAFLMMAGAGALLGIAAGVLAIGLKLLSNVICALSKVALPLLIAQFNNFVTVMERLATVMESSGGQAVAGFLNGIVSGASEVSKKGVEFAKWFIDGVNSKEGLDEHSPSKKGEFIANMFITGFLQHFTFGRYVNQLRSIKSIGSNIASVFEAGLSAGLGSGEDLEGKGLTLIEQIAEGVTDGIQPLVDTLKESFNLEGLLEGTGLEDLMNGDGLMMDFDLNTDLANGKLGGLSDMIDGLGLGDMSNMLSGGTVVTQNQPNQAELNFYNTMVKEFFGMRQDVISVNNDIRKLGNEMTRMKVVLDTGAVAGAVTPLVNRNLGGTFNATKRTNIAYDKAAIRGSRYVTSR